MNDKLLRDGTGASLFHRIVGLFGIAALAAVGCIPITTPNGDGSGEYNNTTDPTNNGATYIGSAACAACHADVGAMHGIHGHAHVLTAINGQPPAFPEAATRAGVPNPPAGFTWNDISYVLGGYTTEARFIDLDGFFLTTGETGVPTQWNLESVRNGTPAEFVDYEPNAVDPLPFDAECLSCHSTGPVALDPVEPRFQDNRPGILGTWAEAGVQCEACHGPGSNHPPQPEARDLFVDSSADACARCHAGDSPGVIEAADGFIRSNVQADELRASGGHSEFNCTFCHNPHASANFDREQAIRNECTTCHSDQTMAGHRGRVYMRGDYVEALSCESCHMPFASRSGSVAPADVAGPLGRMADVRTHIFRINTEAVTSSALFTEDGSAVRTDDQGRAAVTLDFICMRCHHGIGNAFEISLNGASGVADNIHFFDSFGE